MAKYMTTYSFKQSKMIEYKHPNFFEIIFYCLFLLILSSWLVKLLYNVQQPAHFKKHPLSALKHCMAGNVFAVGAMVDRNGQQVGLNGVDHL